MSSSASAADEKAKEYVFSCKLPSGAFEDLTLSQSADNFVFVKKNTQWEKITKTPQQVFTVGLYQGKPAIQPSAEDLNGGPLPTLLTFSDEHTSTPDISFADEAWKKTFKDDVGALSWNNPIHEFLVNEKGTYGYTDDEMKKVYRFISSFLVDVRAELKKLNTSGLKPEEIARLKLSTFHKLIEARGMTYIKSGLFVDSINSLTYDCDLYGALLAAVAYEAEDKPWPVEGVVLPEHFLILWNDPVNKIRLPFDQGSFHSLERYKEYFSGYYRETNLFISKQEVEDQFYKRSASYADLYAGLGLSSMAALQKGRKLTRQGAYVEAEAYLKFAIKQTQRDYSHTSRELIHLGIPLTEYYLALQDLYVAMQEPQKAKAALEKALTVGKDVISLVPSSPNAWSYYYTACLKAGYYEKVIDSSRQSTALVSDLLVFTRIATAYARLGRDKEAFETARRSFAIQADEGLWDYLRWVYLDMNKYDKALEVTREIVKINPSKAFYWLQLGSYAKKLQLNQEALEAYQKALSCDAATAKPFHWDSAAKDLEALGATDDAQKARERSKAKP